MQKFKTIQEANRGIVEHATDWEWAVQKGSADKYQFVTTEGEGMLLRINELGENPTCEELSILKASGLNLGAVDQIDLLYFEVKFNFSELVSRFDLSKDGRIDCSKPQTCLLANAYFHNAVLAADRFVAQTGAIINKVFGKDSTQAESWISRKREIERTNLSYGYCLEERNHIQHVLKPLAIIDVDPITRYGGLGVNLESDYIEYDRRQLQKDYKRLRDEFVQKRIAQGKRPFLSIAGMLPEIQMAIIVLYAEAYETMRAVYENHVTKAEQLGKELGHNGLLIIPKEDDCEAYVQPRRILQWMHPGHRDAFFKRFDELGNRIVDLANNPSFFKDSRGSCFLP